MHNRISCVKHANKLRGRGAIFSPQQNAVLDAFTLALVQNMPELESEDEEEDEEEQMLSPGRAAREA